MERPLAAVVWITALLLMMVSGIQMRMRRRARCSRALPARSGALQAAARQAAVPQGAKPRAARQEFVRVCARPGRAAESGQAAARPWRSRVLRTGVPPPRAAPRSGSCAGGDG